MLALQDTVNTWLADACQAGARIVTGAWAERVLLEPLVGGGAAGDGGAAAKAKAAAAVGGAHRRHRRAVGVLVLAGSAAAPLRLVVQVRGWAGEYKEVCTHCAAAAFPHPTHPRCCPQAPIVISCAGTIHSPALLLRSRLTAGGRVGENLHLHPCTCVVGLMPPGGGAGGGGGGGGGGAAGAAAPGLVDLEDLAPAEQRQQAPAAGAHGVAPPAAAGGIHPWRGTLMSIFSNEAGDWQGSGYGSLLYTPAVRHLR